MEIILILKITVLLTSEVVSWGWEALHRAVSTLSHPHPGPIQHEQLCSRNASLSGFFPIFIPKAHVIRIRNSSCSDKSIAIQTRHRYWD